MPAKKTTKKTTASKKPVAAKKPTTKKVVKATDKKFDEVKKQFEEEAKFVKDEGKVIASGIGRWWENSSPEEKIYTILGIVALIWGLYVLRGMIWGLLLIIIGILFVTGYFVKKD